MLPLFDGKNIDFNVGGLLFDYIHGKLHYFSEIYTQFDENLINFGAEFD